jgi:hypothetical protein
MRTTRTEPQGLVSAKCVTAKHMVVDGIMRLNMDISNTHQSLSESHRLIKNGFFLKILLIQ